MDDEELEIEITKTNSKMIIITLLSVIGTIIVLICLLINSIKSSLKILEKHTYHFVDVTDSNKNEIIKILEDENIEYCESLYRIEYLQLFPDDGVGKIYCNNEDYKTFAIYDDSGKESNYRNYIYENGYTERR